MVVTIKKSSIQGTLQVPPSKSHTIRAVLLASLAKGLSTIHGPLLTGDGFSAIEAAQRFGAIVTPQGDSLLIEGRGIHPVEVIDTKNSGTTTSFVTSIATLAQGDTLITGDEQIQSRPIRVLVDALRDLGCNVQILTEGSDAPPLLVSEGLQGGEVTLDGFNSQFVSSLLLVTPLAKEKTEITVTRPLEKPYIQMTLDWMRSFGAVVESNEPAYTRFTVEGGQHYISGEFSIPSDWSAVAFPLVAALITPSKLTITNLDFHDAQGDKKVVDHLLAMGANMQKNTKEGTLFIQGGTRLQGGLTIDLGDIPDALPALAVAALFTDGITTFTNLAHVRVKESDRVLVMAEELGKLGAKVEIGPDSMKVYGAQSLQGGVVKSHHDHRVAMALSAAALIADEEVVLLDVECTEVSYPNFFSSLAQLGCSCSIRE